MAADFNTARDEATKLAMKMTSATADAMLFVADLTEEFPLLQPVLKTLKSIREKVEAAKSNSEDLAALHQRCAFLTAFFIVKCRQNVSDLDVGPLEDCIKTVGKVIDRCSRRGTISRFIKASSDKDEILQLKGRIGDLEGDLSLAGIATLVRKGFERSRTDFCSVTSRLIHTTTFVSF